MLKTSTTSLALILAAALPMAAPAQDAELVAPPGLYEGDTSPASLEELLADMPGAETIRDISYFDMSRNHYHEALVTMDQNCEDGYCDWKLFAVTEDGWKAVGGGNARDVHFIPTEGGGAVLSVDDILWAYSGGRSLYMWGDLLQGQRPEEAENEEYEMVASQTKYTETAKMRLDRYEVDLNGDDVPERVFMIGGLHYKSGQWGTPYVIFDSHDDLVLQGITTDLPKIFPKADGTGALVVNLVPAGLQVNEIN